MVFPSSPTLAQSRGSLITLEVILMIKVTSKMHASDPYPLPTIIKIGRWRPFGYKPKTCQYWSSNFWVITLP